MRTFIASLGLCVLSVGCHVPCFDFTRTVEQTIETKPLSIVDVSTFNGGIIVEAHDDPTVKMQVTYKAYGESKDEAKQNCEQLDCEIWAEKGRLVIKASKPSDHWMSSAAFTLKVPKSCQLKLHTSNGKVSAENILASVEVNTSNGAVNLKKIKDSVLVKTSNGSITLADCQGAINLSTSNGKVFFAGRLVGEENEIRTSNGRVSIELPTDSLTEVSTRTSNGSITCSLPTQRVLEEGKKKLHAIVGEGSAAATAKLTVRTSNGSIKIDPISSKQDESDLPSASAGQTEFEGGEIVL